jgi:AraC-like DNA-binding protein
MPSRTPTHTNWERFTKAIDESDSRNLTSASQESERTAIWRQLAEKSNYSPPEMAKQCQVSLRHLERCLKNDVGLTPRLWLKWQRLNSALSRLQGTASIKEIAYGLRYRQVSHFCRDFKVRFKITPSEFRRMPEAAQKWLLGMDVPTRAQSSSRKLRFALATQKKNK